MSELVPSSSNLAFVEGLYAEFLRDPNSVPEEWQRYFREMVDGEPAPVRIAPEPVAHSIFNPPSTTQSIDADELWHEQAGHLQDRVDQLVRAYRTGGHKIAQVDPLGFPRTGPLNLEPGYFGFTEADMDRRFSCETLTGPDTMTLREMLQKLRNTYCRSIGVEYMHIDERPIRKWMQERMEECENHLKLGRKEQLRILTRLTDAVVFEEFIRKKFIGAKSFSLEGSESLIPLLDLAIEKAGDQGILEVVIGMAHRGRLNVLCNIMGKSPGEIFREFADTKPAEDGAGGDVKYHKGYSNDWKTSSKKTVHISLCFNPSHLEFVNPVVLGRVRAKQDRTGDHQRNNGLAIVIHGDAAFAGQGVVQETLNLSNLPGYTVGGTLHIIVNNQIGFTTRPNEGRSSAYASDVAKMLSIPIFHVNGEDPEAVAQVVQLALDFRREFKRDVVIDMYGYRRLGHNETDEPSFTQPLLYKAIEQRKPVREGYLEHLLKLGGINQRDANRIAEARQEHFEKELSQSKEPDYQPPTPLPRGTWVGFLGGGDADVPEAGTKTNFSRERLGELLDAQTKFPRDFHPHPKIEKFLQARAKMARAEQALDWSAAEALAFASLAIANHPVRLSGQDVGRGTFSHRHAILHDYEDGHRYIPLQHLDPKQAPVQIYNSPLSEIGVLGFEYGYSLDTPSGLICWEAQFGDFWNVAQVIVDQFMASAEDKWKRLSGLVLLLPHGFEGQGPEHSSARLERFLAMAAEDNIQVAYPSTPANYYHLLRRQVLRPFRKPLVVMTPKSLLRHPEVVSNLEEFATGQFQRILPETTPSVTPDKVKKVLFCSGKIYYELRRKREELKRDDVAIIRLEQLYPLNEALLHEVFGFYAESTPVVWVQEEPENMGASRYLRVKYCEKFLGRHPFSVVSRAASASPATGSASTHKREQEQIINAAFA
ncbi:MAG TPA: 2-oxoglutarate dehydrogenase E1 component [Verrucomicrobiae bacterium]|nr:2-oxoglutarate dehydrogenase E1 component [Verrucomicrobiae bacterium]